MLLLLLLMNDKVALGQDGDPVGSIQGGGGREMVPALFIFGDSLIDNGNNNNLPSFAKANYYPYAELLGLPLIPAYSEASGAQVLHGVNYASATAGILDITGRNFTLYNLGARKFVLAGLGRMGCIPRILAQNQMDRCSEEVNQLVMPFNAHVKTMINNLNANLPGARFTFIDIARMFEDLLTNYRSYGMQFSH
ncbi:GDSL esterase/lipase [Citrus sinensis]|nr:GDSL esterase/lipase [Citrus sinensis]